MTPYLKYLFAHVGELLQSLRKCNWALEAASFLLIPLIAFLATLLSSLVVVVVSAVLVVAVVVVVVVVVDVVDVVVAPSGTTIALSSISA